jgi:four helix bundle protein
MPQDFKKLEIWKESFDFGIEVYKTVIPKIPEKDSYGGINSQLQRAVLSISNNIAEGCGRKTNRDFSNFLHNAIGSCKEVENLLLFVNKLGYLTDDKYKELNDKLDLLGKKLMSFLKIIASKED